MRPILSQWGLLAAGLLAGGGLALHERPQVPAPPAQSYTVAQVEEGLQSDPSQWLGLTVWVRGIWEDTCGGYLEPTAIGVAGPGARCAEPSPGDPENGLADRLTGDPSRDGQLAIVATPQQRYAWQLGGGPLKLAAGVPAYYQIILSRESPCTVDDGGTYAPGPWPPPPGAPSCPVGTVIQAQV
jgi:hypothetical protein